MKNLSSVTNGKDIPTKEYVDNNYSTTSVLQTNKSITKGVEYIIGTQNSDTNAWTGTSTDTGCSNKTIYTGKVIIYHLPKAGTSSAATLNLTLPDGSTTGAKTVYRLASTTTTTTFASGCDILMVFDGTNWKVNAYVDTTGSNTIGYQLRTNYALWANKTGYSTNRYTLLFEVDGGLSGAATTIKTDTNKTTVNFKYIPHGVIKYYSTSGSIANNSYFAVSGLWNQYTCDLGYTFNTGSTLTAGKPVYMRCTVNNDGTLSPNYSGSPSHPIVQDLPSTADNKVYVYLGQAYSATNMELSYDHPIYEYKDGKIREYIAESSSGGSATDVQVNGTSITSNGVANLLTNSAYSSSNNKIATMNDLANFTNIEYDATYNNNDYVGLVGNMGFQVAIGVINLDGDIGAGMIIEENGITLTNFADTSAIPITGDARFNDYVDFEDNVDIQGDLHVYGDFNVEGETAFGDEVTFVDFVTMQDGASVAGDLGIGGDLDVYNTISAGNAIIGTTGNDDVSITGLVEPTNDDDAATKKYVDDICGDIESLLGGI